MHRSFDTVLGGQSGVDHCTTVNQRPDTLHVICRAPEELPFLAAVGWTEDDHGDCEKLLVRRVIVISQ